MLSQVCRVGVGALERSEVREAIIDQRTHVLVAEGVLARASDAPDRDDGVLAQESQLVRDGRLLHPDRIHDL